MPKKKSDKTYGEKLIRLFAVLYFEGRQQSLTELAGRLDCSKQTVLRLVDNLSQAGIPITYEEKNRRHYYYIKRVDKLPRNLSMSPSELSMLYMCLGFTRNLLGKELFQDAERAVHKSSTLTEGQVETAGFAAFLPGSIDYTPRQDDIRRLVEAMDKRRVCKIVYKKPTAARGKTFYIKPYKLFSYDNALYLHAGMAQYPGRKYIRFPFDPLLAVHRLRKVEITERKYVFPQNYDFEKHFNQEFGIIKEEAFQVKLALKGYAAVYAQERRFSPDQKIKKAKDGIVVTFTASSESEVISRVLSFAEEAKVLEPDWLVEEVKNSISEMQKLYG